MPNVRSLVLCGSLALAGAVGLPNAAVAQEGFGLRAIGGDIFSPSSTTFSSYVVQCLTTDAKVTDCATAATGSVMVDAATRKRYRLPSATVAKGTGVAPCGEANCLKMTSTKAVRARLKGVKALPVTITIAATRPVRETLKTKVTLRLKITDRVIFVTSNVAGGSGGRG